MWWRVIAVIAATVVVFTLIDAFDLGGLLGARTAEDARAEAPVSASRQLFWNFLFVAVVLTALMAAARRALTRLRQAVRRDSA